MQLQGASGKKVKKISKYRNRIGKRGSTLRGGAARDLDIILDEEEDAD